MSGRDCGGRDGSRLRSGARPPAEAELRRLYVDLGLSSQAIAERRGVSSQWVRDRLRDHGIALRPRNSARHGLDEVRLNVLYWDEGLSIEAIAARFDRSPSTIRRLLSRYQIPLRPAHPS